MKTRILLVATLAATTVAVLAAKPAFAERKYGMAGCGLGSLLIKPSGNQSTAALLNATGYQTLGITSGTSNCTPSGKGSAYQEIEQQNFFVANFSTLSKEIAQGGGDAVAAFADELGCGQTDTQNVASALQANYNQIFAAPGAVAAFDAARDGLRQNPSIDSSCRFL